MRAASSPEPRADFTPSTYKCGYVDLPRMAEKAQRMVKESLDAFVSRDTALAREVCGEDSAVDALREQVFRELLTFHDGGPADHPARDPSHPDLALPRARR